MSDPIIIKSRKLQAWQKDAAKIFAEKILSYIWEDVAKLDKKSMFKKDYKVFDEVVKDFLIDGDVLDINIGRE